MIPGNYHTHTTFCDGKSTAEEVVRKAIELGMTELGFSGHSHTFFDHTYAMTRWGTREYVATIRQLQEKYRDQIRIYLGVEQDYYSEEPTDEYEYIIGSVHYVKKDGCYLSVDSGRHLQIDSVNRLYHGDFYGFVEDYYATVADVYRKTKCQIVGHFDLITKFNATHDLFDPQHPRYRAAADRALEALLDAPVTLEVNYGAVAKGYTIEQYPSADILSKWLAAGKPVLYSSDCHLAENLLFGYDRYEALIQSCSK